MSDKVSPILYQPIGVVYTTFKESKGTPIQPVASPNSMATVEIFDEFVEGLYQKYI